MLTLVSQRKQMKIFVTPAAKEVVERFASDYDMTEMGVASRIYMWFSRVPKPVQKWVAGLTDANEGEGMRRFADMLSRAVDDARTANDDPTESTVSPHIGGPPTTPHAAPDKSAGRKGAQK